jgi:hypothetical protein
MSNFPDNVPALFAVAFIIVVGITIAKNIVNPQTNVLVDVVSPSVSADNQQSLDGKFVGSWCSNDIGGCISKVVIGGNTTCYVYITNINFKHSGLSCL